MSSVLYRHVRRRPMLAVSERLDHAAQGAHVRCSDAIARGSSMARMLRIIESALPGGNRKPDLTSSSSRCAKRLEQCHRASLCAKKGRNRCARPASSLGGAEPFIGVEQHRTDQVERGEIRSGRNGDDRVGERDLVVVQPRALAAEEQPGAQTRRRRLAQAPRRFGRSQHRLGRRRAPRRRRMKQACRSPSASGSRGERPARPSMTSKDTHRHHRSPHSPPAPGLGATSRKSVVARNWPWRAPSP